MPKVRFKLRGIFSYEKNNSRIGIKLLLDDIITSYSIFENDLLAYTSSRTKIERNIFQMLSYQLDNSVFTKPEYQNYRSLVEHTVKKKRADLVIRNKNDETITHLFEGKQTYSHECPLKGTALSDFTDDLQKLKNYHGDYKLYYLACFVHYHKPVPDHFKYSGLINENTQSLEDVYNNTKNWIMKFYQEDNKHKVIDISKQFIGKVENIKVSLILGLIEYQR